MAEAKYMESTSTESAFEKATHIYRFLRSRSKIAPLYLNRNLNYMLNRSKRTNNARRTFKVNSIFENMKNAWPVPLNKYMTLMFLGYNDEPEIDVDAIKVEIETFVLKTALEQDDQQSVYVGKSMLKPIPHGYATSQSKIPSISVSTANFKPLETSYQLVLKARVSSNKMVTTSNNNNKAERVIQMYESVLDVFDQQNRCQLTDAEYEVPLHKCSALQSKSLSMKKQPIWESEELVVGTRSSYKLMSHDSQKLPVLKFRIVWSAKRYLEKMDCPLPIKIKEQKMEIIKTVENIEKETAIIIELEYSFYIQNNPDVVKLQDIFECPLCNLDCLVLYSLLKHLRLCHARFIFTYVPYCGARLRISVHANESYYDSDEFDDPLNRTKNVFTRILVHRSRREKPSLTEFFDVNEFYNQRLYAGETNRIFYHSTSLQPVQANDSDSADEIGWIPKHIEKLIDKFTGVNEGEKEIIKMWNNHMLRNRYYSGDIQVRSTCESFVDQMGIEILRKNLYQNFLLHMCHLADLGAITLEVHLQIILRLQRIVSGDKETQEIMKTAREQHKIYWKTTRATEHQQQNSQRYQNYSNIKDVKVATLQSSNRAFKPKKI